VREFAMLSKRGLRSCVAFNAAAANKDGYAEFCETMLKMLPQNPHFYSDAAGTLGGLADEVRVVLYAPFLLGVDLET
jgi:hypothetical protein